MRADVGHTGSNAISRTRLLTGRPDALEATSTVLAMLQPPTVRAASATRALGGTRDGGRARVWAGASGVAHRRAHAASVVRGP